MCWGTDWSCCLLKCKYKTLSILKSISLDLMRLFQRNLFLFPLLLHAQPDKVFFLDFDQQFDFDHLSMTTQLMFKKVLHCTQSRYSSHHQRYNFTSGFSAWKLRFYARGLNVLMCQGWLCWKVDNLSGHLSQKLYLTCIHYILLQQQRWNI